MDTSDFQAILERGLPHILPGSIKLIDSGWGSWVFDVNDEYIFRVPRRPEIELQHARERVVLAGLASRLSLRIPLVEFVLSGGPGSSLHLVGYRKIHGEPLAGDLLGSTLIARQLGQFLSELHTYPVEQSVRLGLLSCSTEEWQKQYVDFWEWVKQNVMPLLDSKARAFTNRLWKGYLDDPTNLDFVPALIHSDLGAEHILCDPQEKRITGIIDWEDAAIGDPALDFVGLLYAGRRTFVKRVLKYYRSELGKNFWQRVIFYKNIVPFHEIRFGLLTGDEAHLQQGLEALSHLTLRTKRGIYAKS